jgi:hypothetical protein
MVTQQSREQRRDLAVHLHRCDDGEVAAIVEEALVPVAPPVASEDEPPMDHEGEAEERAEAERIKEEQAKAQRLHKEAERVDAERAGFVGGQDIGKTETGLGGGDTFVDNPHQGERNDGPELAIEDTANPEYEGMVPPDGTMNDVLAWVDAANTSEDCRRRAQAALDAEDRREKPRESIKPMLNRRLK